MGMFTENQRNRGQGLMIGGGAGRRKKNKSLWGSLGTYGLILKLLLFLKLFFSNIFNSSISLNIGACVLIRAAN